MDEWITVKEAMKRLGVSKNTIYRWARQGLITIYKLGPRVSRIKLEDLEKIPKPFLPKGYEPLFAKREDDVKSNGPGIGVSSRR